MVPREQGRRMAPEVEDDNISDLFLYYHSQIVYYYFTPEFDAIAIIPMQVLIYSSDPVENALLLNDERVEMVMYGMSMTFFFLFPSPSCCPGANLLPKGTSHSCNPKRAGDMQTCREEQHREESGL